VSDNFGTEEASLIDFFDPEKVLAEQGTERDVYIYRRSYARSLSDAE
jgi:hypothetical protein